MKRKFCKGDIIVVNPHIKPDHCDYVVLKNAEDEADRDALLFTFHASRSFGITGKVVEKKRY
ncbi:MAG: hypothetical protein AB1480_07860 [Nitrospirota bacterium]